MTHHPIKPDHNARTVPAAGLAALLLCLCWQGANSQNSGDNDPIAVNGPFESRLIRDSELEDYLVRVAAMLPMTTRERDPFGSQQDPDAKISTPESLATNGTPQVAIPTVAFEDVVRLINVTTVMPASEKFLLGTRSFGVNDVFPVNYRGRTYRIRVEAVNSRQIRFRNVENDEVATRTLNSTPAGMSAGGAPQAIPGLIRAGQNVPIDLD